MTEATAQVPDLKVKLNADVAVLTLKLVKRLSEGFDHLTKLEAKLLEKAENTTDAQFLLSVCKYFRCSTAQELANIWDLAVKIVARRSAPIGKGDELSEIEAYLASLPPTKRQQILNAVEEGRTIEMS